MKKRYLLLGLLILLLICIFFWQVILLGYVPFPGDLLVGAYYPWLEYKWGFPAGVPVKNGLISDVFSEMYVWKYLSIESFKNFRWPLWNPYVYSGYPLLANFSSGSLYLFNFLLLLGSYGWSLMIILQVLGTALAMFWFLTQRKYSAFPAVAGALAFAFSASMMGRLEWNSAGHVIMWLSISLAVLEYFFERNRKIILLFPFTLFLLITAGHFQTMFYSLLILGSYGLYKVVEKRNRGYMLDLALFTGIGLCLSAIQIVPTFFMMEKSIRFSEAAVGRDNFGLLPLSNLITLIAPDFFGNPTTGNFWGFLNYSETIFYPGVIGLFAFLWAGFNLGKLGKFSKFMFFLGVFAVLLAFDNPLGRLVYQIKIPFLSTGYAARVAVIFMFSTSVLIAEFFSGITKAKIRSLLGPFLMIFSGLLFVAVFSYLGGTPNLSIGLRNLVIPGFLFAAFTSALIFRRFRVTTLLILAILVADLFRFGWKYNPFVPMQFVYPQTPVTDFLKKQSGLFRIETQDRPILPAQTWAVYGLSSPAGYDPLVGKDYALGYSRLLNNSEMATRYSTLGSYDAEALGDFNVKYLLFDKEHPPLEKLSGESWTPVFETEKIQIFENREFKERISYTDPNAGEITVQEYSPNRIQFGYNSETSGEIVIRDSWDQGWRATVNGEPVVVEKYKDIFRKVPVPSGKGMVVIEYLPAGWVMGTKLFVLGLVGFALSALYIIKHKHDQN